ncbi:hypothetical protein [Ottowia oryzae]
MQIVFWGDYDAFAARLLSQYRLSVLLTPAPALDAGGVADTRAVCSDFDVVLLDSYALDQRYIDGLKGRACRLALMDDDQRHDLNGADLVICFRAGAEALDYGARCQLLGPSYFPAKPELSTLRACNLSLPADRPIERVLVFLSGGDLGAQYLPAVLHALDSAGVRVSYLAANPLPSLASQQARHIALTPAIESVYAQCDLVLCGGGLTKYECAFAGIANACLSLTTLQNQDTRIMATLGFTLNLGLAERLVPNQLRRKISNFIRNPGARAVQRRAFASHWDADGPHRAAQALLAL